MIIKDKTVLIVGLAKTGVSTIKQLNKRGANIIVNDIKNENTLADIIDEIKDLNNIQFILGKHPENLDNIDFVVLSPGVPLDIPFIENLRNKNIEIIGEIELAYRLSNESIYIGITGTNGKTTTTSLTGEIFKSDNKDTFIVGNIGNPVIDTIDIAHRDSFIITELSSFQLETVDTFRPNISAILNITEDHLNRHKTVENYINAKANIFKNQRAKDFCILNYDDPAVRNLADQIAATKVFFSTKEELELGVYLDSNNDIVINLDNKVVLLNKDELSLPGEHNLQNAMAAIAIVYICNINLETVKNVLRTFGGVEHRQEFVRNVNGVTFVNDSKATNPDSTIKALNSYTKPIILIAGGLDKNGDFNELLSIAKGKVKGLVLLGETSSKLKELALYNGINNVHEVSSMQEAVQTSYKLATHDDIVLLSPACASWDMYKNFEVRGNDFKNNVFEII